MLAGGFAALGRGGFGAPGFALGGLRSLGVLARRRLFTSGGLAVFGGRVLRLGGGVLVATRLREPGARLDAALAGVRAPAHQQKRDNGEQQDDDDRDDDPFH